MSEPKTKPELDAILAKRWVTEDEEWILIGRLWRCAAQVLLEDWSGDKTPLPLSDSRCLVGGAAAIAKSFEAFGALRTVRLMREHTWQILRFIKVEQTESGRYCETASLARKRYTPAASELAKSFISWRTFVLGGAWSEFPELVNVWELCAALQQTHDPTAGMN